MESQTKHDEGAERPSGDRDFEASFDDPKARGKGPERKQAPREKGLGGESTPSEWRWDGLRGEGYGVTSLDAVRIRDRRVWSWGIETVFGYVIHGRIGRERIGILTHRPLESLYEIRPPEDA